MKKTKKLRKAFGKVAGRVAGKAFNAAKSTLRVSVGITETLVGYSLLCVSMPLTVAGAFAAFACPPLAIVAVAIPAVTLIGGSAIAANGMRKVANAPRDKKKKNKFNGEVFSPSRPLAF